MNNEIPYLSVVLPVFNEATIICSTINEISNYLYKNNVHYELIIVNDGSTDKTAKIINENIATKKIFL